MIKGQRQSRIAIFSDAISSIKMIGWPIIFIFFGGQHTWSTRIMILGAGLVLALLFGLLNWFFFTYDMSSYELTTSQGIFVKKHVHMPFERVQTITRTQPIYFRPFNVFKVNVETSGKNDDKLIFNALSLSQIEYIETRRQEAQTKQSDVEMAAVQPEVSATYQINNRDLILYALTSLGSLGTMGIIYAGLTMMNDLMPQNIQNRFYGLFNHQTMTVYALLVFIVLMIAIILSFLRLYGHYFKFTISRIGSHLAIKRGLLTIRAVNLRTSRIQAVYYEQTLLRRLVHLVSVKVLLASSMKEDEEQTKQTTLIPVVTEHQSSKILHRFLPKYNFQQPDKAPVASHALFLRLRFIFLLDLMVILLLLVAFELTLMSLQVTFSFWWLLVATVILLVYTLGGAYIAMSDQGLSLTDDQLIIQRTINYTKRTYFIPYEKIQGYTISQTWFMVRQKTQHIHIIVRDGDSSQLVTLRYLKASSIDQLDEILKHVK